MGVRIKKCIGYGFDDLVENDPRIDFDIFNENFENSKEEFIGYLQLVKDSSNTEFMLHDILNRKQGQDWNFYDKVIYDSEYGLSNVMLFIHPDANDWHRRDDIIDFCESVEIEPYACKCSRLSRGIYPYNIGKHYYHLPTKKFIDSEVVDYLKYTKSKTIKSIDGTEIDYYNNIGNDCIPEVPLLIKHLAMYAGVDPLVVDSLRPLTYTYWS